MAQDPESGRLTEETVLRTSTRTVPAVLDLAAVGVVITCSPAHPFWVGTGWRRAGDLRGGDRLRTSAGDGAEVSVSEPRPGRRWSGWTVHNITVDRPHTYHVGTIGILVHNKAIEAHFVPRQRVLQAEAHSLFQRAGDAVQRAQALPEDTPYLEQTVREAQGLSREARDLQVDINQSSSLAELADLQDYQASIRARLAALEQRLPSPTEPPAQPTVPTLQTFDTVEAAIGMVEGKASVVQTVGTVNPGLRSQGFTKTVYAVDNNGTQWTVHHNPGTGQYFGAHHSSSN